MSSLQLFKDFDPSSVDEGSVRSMDNRAKIVYLNHGPDKCPIILQTTTLRSIKGIENNDYGDGPTKYTMELALSPDDAEYQKLAEFDQRIIDIAATSKQKWINTKNGSVPNRELLEELYTPTLKIPRDKQTGEVSDRWPPTFKVTIPQRRDTGEFDLELWDSSKNKIDVKNFITSGSSRNAQMTVIVKCTGVWVGGGKFGTTWKAHQILVHAAGRQSIGSFAFINPESLLDRTTSGVLPQLERQAPAAAPEEDDGDEYIDDSD